LTRGPPHAFRVRRARPSDADNIARICEESFAEQFNHPGLVRSLLLPHSDQGGVDLAHQLRLAMMRKREAAMEHRLSRVERQRRALAVALAAARGEPSIVGPSPRTAQELRQEARWVHRRKFASLVAEDVESGELVACSTVCMMAAEALLPPPFPTSKQPRFYVSNIAVRAEHRRRGVASTVLQSIELLAARWCQSGVWMHVDDDNLAAQALYRKHGYRVHSLDPLWAFGRRRMLLSKPVRPWSRVFARTALPTPRMVVATPSEGGARARREPGVFVWTRHVGDGAGEGAGDA